MAHRELEREALAPDVIVIGGDANLALTAWHEDLLATAGATGTQSMGPSVSEASKGFKPAEAMTLLTAMWLVSTPCVSPSQYREAEQLRLSERRCSKQPTSQVLKQFERGGE